MSSPKRPNELGLGIRDWGLGGPGPQSLIPQLTAAGPRGILAYADMVYTPYLGGFAVETRTQNPRTCAKHLFPLILRLGKRATDDAAAQLRPWGVTPTQYGAMCFLLERSLTASELGRLMLLTSTTMTGIIDRLERDGLVERGSNPEDRRQSPVVLTERGRTLVERLRVVPIEPRGQLEEGLAVLTDCERAELERLIVRIIAGLGDEEFLEAAEATMQQIEGLSPNEHDAEEDKRAENKG